MASRPTPTQAENDAAALGEHIMDKEPDGSPLDPNINPTDVHGHTAETRKQMEAKPGSGGPGSYQTRASRAVPRSE